MKRLRWTYPHNPSKSLSREFTIGFRYAEPVGAIKLIVRANLGPIGSSMVKYLSTDTRVRAPKTS